MRRGWMERAFETHTLSFVAALCLVSVTIPATLWLYAERDNVGAVPRAIAEQGAATRKFVGDWLTANVMPPVNSMVGTVNGLPAIAIGEVQRQGDAIRGDLFHQVDALRVDVLGPDGRFVGLQNAVLQRADVGLGVIQDLRKDDVGPLLAEVRGTVKTYGELPATLGAELRPAWKALEPEFTCRMPDAFGLPTIGYGGCWHSRATSLMGDAARVGGIFTQHAPSFFATADGIGQDFHGFADKYVMPHKLTAWDKVKIGLGIVRDGGIAWLRSGR